MVRDVLYLLIWVLSLPGHTLQGQTSLNTIEFIDSLKLSLHTAQSDVRDVSTLTHLCTKYMYVNPDSSIHYGKLAVEAAIRAGSIPDKLFAKGLLAFYYHSKGTNH